MPFEELALLLTKAADAFTSILGKPSHDNLVRLREALTTILLQDGYDRAHANHKL